MEEKEILSYWQKEKIFEKSLKKRKGAPHFVFFEGPPFANAHPGIHHVLARAYKDLIAKYKTMQGNLVLRKAGWDTHGLPTEMAVEKQLKIKSKKDIEGLGIEKFIKMCRENIFTYKKEWEELTEKIGYFLDLKNAYITCDSKYIESVWWALKEIWGRGLIYEDYRVVPFCPRCGTSLSDHEVALGYKNVFDPSVFVKFKLIADSQRQKADLLVFTTTPWTLPANTALAINPNAEYVKIKLKGEILILARARLPVIKEKYQVLTKIKGSELIGVKYEPPFLISKDENVYRVVPADFVNLTEGTGIVHIAPAYGADDLNLAKKENLPILATVSEDGKINEKVPQFKGKFVKDADKLIINFLHQKKLLYFSSEIKHNYPFCWRCDTPLLYLAKNSWYIKTTAVKDKMLDANKKINWIPGYIKNGRFGNWLKENVDWAISRERFWGSPIPIWRCEKCKDKICVGSIKELNQLTTNRYNLTANSDLHRPYIDDIVLKCKKCGGKMQRIPEVLDCWFDSGSMPFAQWHYPFENKKEFQENYPADFIAEGIDQTRGWFYTLLAISVLLDLPAAYRNVISLGLVLDEQGQKMSKSRGNIIDPDTVIKKYGADAVRLYFYLAPQGETVRFSEKEVGKIYRKFIMTAKNSLAFYLTYDRLKLDNQKDNLTILDRWIWSRFYEVLQKITQHLDKFDVTFAARELSNFVISDLSNWYIRRSRKRNSKIFYDNLKQVLTLLSCVSAPFAPFLSENIFQKLSQKNESVHLSDWPKINGKQIDKELNEKMALVRKICELGLAERAKNNIKVRQPLQQITIYNPQSSISDDLTSLIKDELNVKNVTFKNLGKKLGEVKVKLNTEITNELRKEGLGREIIRQIQALRKKAGFSPRNIASVSFHTEDLDLLDVIQKFGKRIEDETGSQLKRFRNSLKQGEKFKIEEKIIEIGIIKLKVQSSNVK